MSPTTEAARSRIDVLARRWGSAEGGPDGMAVAASYLAFTLCELDFEVRGYRAPGGVDPWQHPRMTWAVRANLATPDDFTADLYITTISPTWRRTAEAARAAGTLDRLVYWHHHSGLPPSYGGLLAAPPAIEPTPDWSRAVVLPPASWAAEARGPRDGAEVLVPGASVAKGGHVAAAVAAICPDLRWYVLPGRAAPDDVARWCGFPSVEVARGHVAPASFLARARLVLSPTRFEVHPLALIEAAVRGIPVVCSDLPGTRAALGESAIFVPAAAGPRVWADAVRRALAAPLPLLRLRPYREVVSEALAQLLPAQALRRTA